MVNVTVLYLIVGITHLYEPSLVIHLSSGLIYMFPHMSACYQSVLRFKNASLDRPGGLVVKIQTDSAPGALVVCNTR